MDVIDLDLVGLTSTGCWFCRVIVAIVINYYYCVLASPWHSNWADGLDLQRHKPCNMPPCRYL